MYSHVHFILSVPFKLSNSHKKTFKDYKQKKNWTSESELPFLRYLFKTTALVPTLFNTFKYKNVANKSWHSALHSHCHFTLNMKIIKRENKKKTICMCAFCVYVCLWLMYWRALHGYWQKDKFASLVLVCPSRASVHSLAGEMNWDKMSEQEMSDHRQTTALHNTDRHTHTHAHTKE